ncbi:Hypothetical predicted protein [Mytilus galloprovincialis]|uniref:Uncharacterized protein n=2 Tax=Mytilus galloprovincialis TaxID=29158 RepID=A0A8B6DMB0_MYTGA|nr:Hypothetical predicted protein [Mytilus galloprovincialis]
MNACKTLTNCAMAIPLDKEGTRRKDDNSTSKYKLQDSERKLPRPVVFWSENEKDAFRRNKVVQTRYYMLLDDIETQQRSSEKSIRHEAHKFRQRYKADVICSSDNSSSVGFSDVTSLTESVPKKITREKSFSSDSGSDTSSDHWTEIPKKGVITKIRKSNVKFSFMNDVIPDDSASVIDQVKASTDLSTQRKLRSQSASQSRSTKTNFSSGRSKSAVLKTGIYSARGDDQMCSSKTKTVVNPRENTEEISKYNKQTKKPNSIFFDRSQAAYQLRKELQKLAKNRKNGVVKVAYTMEDAIRDEKDKLTASSKKVADYIQKLEIDNKNMKINEWTSKTIEPVIS